VLGGFFVDTVGWRVGQCVVTAVLFALVPLGAYLLPADALDQPPSRLALRIMVWQDFLFDWVGTGIASAALPMLAVVLVQLLGSSSAIRTSAVIALLTLSLLLLVAFPCWMNLAARRNWPVLIPNSLWRQLPFTSVCIMVLLSYGVIQTMGFFCRFFLQNVQNLSPIEASIRLLPSTKIGAVSILTTGFFIHKLSPVLIVFASSFMCAGAPLAMALINPKWPYWYAAFPAQMVQPVSPPPSTSPSFPPYSLSLSH